tara:strand:+ start:8507 stop:9394 length:888 start_codon:yes stop_codon:yes gene_type:complete
MKYWKHKKGDESLSVFSQMNKDKTTMYIGGYGSGKTTQAKETIGEDYIVVYGEELDDSYLSLPPHLGMIIEEVHLCKDTDALLDLMRIRDRLVLTSINKKDVSKKIVNMCKVKSLGQKNNWYEQILEIAPRAEQSFSDEKSVTELVSRFLREKNRDDLSMSLKKHRPPETQLMTWLCENFMNEKIAYVDGLVKWKWHKDYFYEMLAYSHKGGNYLKFQAPKRATYSEYPHMARRLGLKRKETGLMLDLLCDEDFKEWAKTKLEHKHCRLLKLGEKRKKRNLMIELDKTKRLSEWM